MKNTIPPRVPPAGAAQGRQEEPEFAQEDDIPSDDGGAPEAADQVKPEKRPLRHVERE